MDVEELLNYKPSRSLEDDENTENFERARKQRRRKLGDTNIDIDLAAAPQTTFDEPALKRLLLQFERKVLKNQELRIKFAGNPTKFMDSEVELFDVIKEMHVLSTHTEYDHIIVELNVVSSLLGLLSHENTDISCAVVGLLQELSDLDGVEEINDVAVLLDSLINGQIVAQLVSNMERLDETVKEEAEGIYNSLAIVENLTDYKPDLSNDAQPLLQWILKRLKAKLPFDGNKLYASEILAILLQDNDTNKKLIGELDGIDTLLQQLAHFKRHDPASTDEQEYMENLFDALCSSLLLCPPNRELFFRGEGVELMNLILKEKRKKGSYSTVRMGALKVINYSLSAEKDNQEIIESICNKFVEILGLRSLFPILLKPRAIIGSKKESNAVDDVEEHCLSIILALLNNCKTENKKRVLGKFIECDYEKTDRLLELHFKYAEKLLKCDSVIKKERAQKLVNDEAINEDSFYMRRLTDGGLFTLQIIDQLIVLCCSLFDEFQMENAAEEGKPTKETLKGRIMKLINLHANASVNHYKFIKNIVKNLANEQQNDNDKQRLLSLIDDF